MKGGISNVWFDRFKISNDCPEHLESIDAMCQVLTDLIDDEVKSGIKKNRILIGGFSMGGCMAMHLAYRNHQDVAGVFALSSFLNKTSAVYQVSLSL
ncbi:lysophospholipase like 1 [Phyllostomus discolor]|uniref:palmitoyl-protein hydrolase n=1 Tax=Phyllostomus discolor TaxID=89673 RepID=A0A833YGX1_9CHIR|nr:lysophospholipase like 1 [Phyllostomus discolor]